AIQPLTTRKTGRSWGDEKELQRAQKILVAAAEQAKQFVVPVLLPVFSLELWLTKLDKDNNCHLFFDAAGDPLSEVLPKLSKNNYQELIILSGPEGDLTLAEKEDLKRSNFIFSKLTPTILRAQQAVTIGLGILRSLM
ncbi:MAG: RNA methyltransferase, partial [Tatlockia sp.]|nr:RNA methyltransferase [Tatlockia sp.]